MIKYDKRNVNGGETMMRFKCIFDVYDASGRYVGRSESVVSASDPYSAQKLVEAQYTGCRIIWISSNPV